MNTLDPLVAKRGAAASLLTVAVSMAATVLPPLLPLSRNYGLDTICRYHTCGVPHA